MKLHLLPLMYWYDLQDLLFLVKCLQNPSDNFNIFNYVSFSATTTRSNSAGKLKHNFRRTSTTRHFYFNRVVRLWNKIPEHIDLTLSFNSIKNHLSSHLWDHFITNFNPNSICSFHYVCPCPTCYTHSS